jgi:excisionase family DNA binding protein
MAEIEENAVYTTREVAELLKVSLPTIKRMLKDKRLRSTRIGKQHRFLGRDLLELLSEKMDLRQERPSSPLSSAAPAVAVEPMRSPSPAGAAGSWETPRGMVSAAEQSQRTYMRGKILTKDVFDNDGSLLFGRGCVVTDELIEIAKKKRRLMELFSSVSHDD